MKFIIKNSRSNILLHVTVGNNNANSKQTNLRKFHYLDKHRLQILKLNHSILLFPINN